MRQNKKKTTTKQPLRPPEPYMSWLEYAVSTFSTRDAQWECNADSETIRQAVVAEYVALCKAAGIVVPSETIEDLLNLRIPHFRDKPSHDSSPAT